MLKFNKEEASKSSGDKTTANFWDGEKWQNNSVDVDSFIVWNDFRRNLNSRPSLKPTKTTTIEK